MNPNGRTYRPSRQTYIDPAESWTPTSHRSRAIARLENAKRDLDAAIASMRLDADIDVDEILATREAVHVVTQTLTNLRHGA